MARVITSAVAGVLGLIVLLVAAATAAIPRFGGGGSPLTCTAALGAPPAGLSAGQWKNAATIVHTGQRMSVPAYGWIIAVATALQESNLVNLGHLGAHNDHDSLGLFQQRPSQGWGTPHQLTDPEYASKEFYQKLITISGWQDLPLTVAAQRVQISAYPQAYAKHEGRARAIVGALRGSCGAVSASGWMVPVVAPIVSGFHTPERPSHHGVDFGASRGTPVHAAAAGTVITVVCNVNRANYGPELASSPCDVDGSPQTSGCGWMVEVRHRLMASNEDIVSRYCHLLGRPQVEIGSTVTAGQVIGLVGNSGNSSGPHLHFEIHRGAWARAESAISPEDFLRSQGVALES